MEPESFADLEMLQSALGSVFSDRVKRHALEAIEARPGEVQLVIADHELATHASTPDALL